MAVTALVVSTPGIHAQPIPTARIDSIFVRMNRSDRPGCALGVYRAGDVVYARGYGMANLEYGIALQPRSVFHVASISKQFTAFAVELLVSEGRVSWDDPIQKYVPELPDYGVPITLRHLAHHTSGIRDQWNLLGMAGWRWEADLVTQADALEILSRQTALNFPPGDEYLYSNSGFTLLAAVVERISGQTLREFTEERIFSPLGMGNTHFHDDHQMIVPDRAYGYRFAPRDGWKISIPDFAIVGASSLFTTVEDMARWDRNLRDHILGDAELYRRYFDVGVLNGGDTLTYAHSITRTTYRGLTRIGHTGADAGYRSAYARFPDEDLGIATFCNFARANPAAYVDAVTDILLEDQLQPVVESDEAPAVDTERWRATWEAMEGFYRSARSDIPLHVWMYQGNARVGPGLGTGRAGELLVPNGDGTFRLWSSGRPLRVEREGGRVRGLQVGSSRYEFVGPQATGVDPSPYLGTYWSDELGTEYRVEPDSGRATFVLTHRKLDPQRFRPANADSFTSRGQWLTFERDPGGTVTGFTWSNGRVRRVRFVRRN